MPAEQGTVVSDGEILRIESGETLDNITVNSGGRLIVAEGGTATDAVINSGGNLIVASGGTANSNTVYYSGYLYAYGTVNSTLVDKGDLYVSNGGVANDTTLMNFGFFHVSEGGIANRTVADADGILYVWGGGSVDSTIVNASGTLDVREIGARATNIIENGGYVSVVDGAEVSFLPNTFSGVAAGSWGVTVHSGTTAVSTTANSRSCVYVKSGGTAIATMVSNEGRVIVSSGGTANSNTVSSAGELLVYSGGTANGVTIFNLGSADFYKGGKVTGQMTFESGAIVSAYTGTIIDFDLTQAEAGGAALVNDLSIIQGTPNFTITVDGMQENGIYALAEGAADFAGTITVVNIAGEELGTLSVGGSLIVSSIAYTLTLSGSALSVSVDDGGHGGGVTSTGLVLTSESRTVNSGEIFEYTTVCDDGSLNIVNGGTASFNTVSSGGKIHVSSGGTANGNTIHYSGGFYVSNGGTANSTLINNATFKLYGTASDTTVTNYGLFYVSSGGTANRMIVDSRSHVYVYDSGTVNSATVNASGEVLLSSGATATDIIENGGYVEIKDGATATFQTNTFSGVVLSGSSATLHSGTTASGTTLNTLGTLYVFNGGEAKNTTVDRNGDMYISSGGKATGTVINSDGRCFVRINGMANDTTVNSGGGCYVSQGGSADCITANAQGRIYIYGEALVNGATVNPGGILKVSSGGKATGKMMFVAGATVFMSAGATLDFDLTQAEAGGAALVNDLSVIQGTPSYTLTVDGTQENGVYALAEGAAGFTGTITVQNTLEESLGTLSAGETLTVDGTDYLLTNEAGTLSLTVKDEEPARAKWTYLVYMAADSNLCECALYDIVSMQQANVDSEIDIYVLADRSPIGSEGNGDYVTPNGTYKWDSPWSDTRVGKITSSPGLTVMVDWESWGELDTGSIETVKRFVDWAQEESPAENYGLILWDHGGENATLCYDLTTDPNWDAFITVSEVSGLLKEKGNIPIVVFNACLLGSEIVATQMAGSTDVIVASEPVSYGISTFNYNAFFNTITQDMTAQEMAAILVRNVDPVVDDVTMLSAVDVRDPRLGEALEALADAVEVAGNDADKAVLINAMLRASQDGCLYNGSEVQQSDLGDLILQAISGRLRKK